MRSGASTGDQQVVPRPGISHIEQVVLGGGRVHDPYTFPGVILVVQPRPEAQTLKEH